MRVALCQLNATVGDLGGNAARILAWYRRAAERGAGLVVFPELALTGYPPRDLLDLTDFLREVEDAVHRLAGATGAAGLVFGAPVPNPGASGKPLHNAALFCAEGRVRHEVRKKLLPTYDVFDEARYFEPDPEPARPVEFGGIRWGLHICEDAWNQEGFWPRRLYRRDPVEELAGNGAQILAQHLRLALLRPEGPAPPLDLPEPRRPPPPAPSLHEPGGGKRRADLRRRGVRLRCPGGAGRQRPPLRGGDPVRGGGGGGGRGAGDPGPLRRTPRRPGPESPPGSGRNRRRSPPSIAPWCWGSGTTRGSAGSGPRSSGSRVGSTRRWWPPWRPRPWGRKTCGGSRYPAATPATTSNADAEAVARNLGIRYEMLAIESIFAASLETLAGLFAGTETGLAEENIQARARVILVMALSNKFGHLVLTTGNKSELAVGYCTLYGDMAGGLAVISDVPKVMVYELARELNRDAGDDSGERAHQAALGGTQARPDRPGHAPPLRTPGRDPRGLHRGAASAKRNWWRAGIRGKWWSASCAWWPGPSTSDGRRRPGSRSPPRRSEAGAACPSPRRGRSRGAGNPVRDV